MKPSWIIPQFDQYLKHRNLSFEGIVIGGAALALLGVISRETQDCDIIDPVIPHEILEAAKDFGQQLKIEETSLKENWLNNGPTTLVPQLPKYWKARLVPLFQGEALILWSLGRMDLLSTKLLAFCDRGQDLGDCMAMKPSLEELQQIQSWLSLQDENPDWPTHVEFSLRELAKRLGYEF